MSRVITDYTRAEEGFVHDTWARSYRSSLPSIDNDLFFSWHRKIRNELLPRCQVRVCRDSADPTYIYGYSVSETQGEDLLIHWVYVRYSERGEGVGTLLFQDLLERNPSASNIYHTHKPKHFPMSRLSEVHYKQVSHVL